MRLNLKLYKECIVKLGLIVLTEVYVRFFHKTPIWLWVICCST